MVSRSHIGSYALLASMYSAVSSGAIPASNRRLDAHAIVFEVSGRSGDLSSEASLLRTSSFLELALLAVLFLLVGGLVAIRITEELADRDVELAALPTSFRSETASESSPADRETETNSSPTDDHERHSFEHYLSPETPSELLSDEGEVVRLLVANQGRLRQHEIADETEWSKSKVSRICSRMDADGTIEKASVGRENVISLSDRSTDRPAQSADAENPLS